MIDTNNERCFGCSLCQNICPTNAISMKEDEKGFYKPSIDTEKCIKCNLCEKRCPINLPLESKPLTSFAIKIKDIQERKESASGGMFYALASRFIKDKGIVYGAIFDENFVVKHIRTDNFDGIKKMRGSKYVQSNFIGILSSIKKDLANGKKVLFTGTPCQVAAVKLFTDADNLYTCDIICHGVSSPRVFRDFVNSIKKKYGQFTFLTFRDKNISWHGCNTTIEVNGKRVTNTLYLNVFKNIYYGHYATRASCHFCNFANPNRVSDMTIGDFWGIEKIKEDFDDGYGVSLILINSKKGKEMFRSIDNECYYFEHSYLDSRQPQLHAPTQKCDLSDAFWNDYQKKGFNYISRTYGERGLVARIKNAVKKVLKR